MKAKIFNKALVALLCITIALRANAQAVTDTIVSSNINPATIDATANTRVNNHLKQLRRLDRQINGLGSKIAKINSEEIVKNMKLNLNVQAHVEANLNKSLQGLKDFQFHFDDSAIPGININIDTVVSNLKGFNYKIDGGFYKKTEKGGAFEKTKTYTKSYTLDDNDQVSIDNSFGKVTVNTWAKNEVKVDVQIRVAANDDERAGKYLDNVSISDGKTASTVAFKTNFADNDGMWKGHNREIEVDYNVYMPAKTPISIKNSFGGIKIPTLNGKVDIKLSYGILTADELNNSQNQVAVSFGDANIGSFNGDGVKVSYGKLNIGAANDLNAKLSFASGTVDKLRSAGDISVSYGDGLKVGRLIDVKNLYINSSFTKVVVNVQDNYNFDVNTKMGNFNYDNNGAVKVTETTPENTHSFSATKSYKGTIGKGNTAKTITIKSSFGSVKFDDTKN